MIKNYKPFEKSLYNKFDNAAKQTCIEYLISTGKYSLITPLEDQGEAFKTRDFYIQEIGSGKDIFCECEVKTVWKVQGKWQTPFWASIDIPYRKRQSKADIFFVLNNSLDTLAVISREILFSSTIGYKNTKNSYTGTRTKEEPFFQVPIDKISFFTRVSNNWKAVHSI